MAQNHKGGDAYGYVVLLSLRVARLDDGQDTSLHMPGEHDLRASDAVFLGEVDDCGVFADGRVS